MALLFDRQVAVSVDAVKVTGLRVQFKIEKTLQREPNTLDLSITNLSTSTRAKMKNKGAKVLVEAGYPANYVDKELAFEQIFQGDSRIITHFQRGADWVTRIQGGDGEADLQKARCNFSLAAGATIEDVAKKIAATMKTGTGNLAAKLKAHDYKGAVESFVNGLVVSGKSSDKMTEILKAAGLEWSVQDGAIQALAPEEATQDTAILLSASSGMVGSPELGEKGITKVVSLLQPRIRPGRRIQLDSVAIKGLFRIDKVTHTGDTAGQDWYSQMELRPLT